MSEVHILLLSGFISGAAFTGFCVALFRHVVHGGTPTALVDVLPHDSAPAGSSSQCSLDAHRLERIDAVLTQGRGGIFKRIDENRELVELLRAEHPEVLSNLFWVEGWLSDQDRFLVALAQAAQCPYPSHHAGRSFPRPWPHGQSVTTPRPAPVESVEVSD